MKDRFRKARLRPEPKVRMTMSLPRLYGRSHPGLFNHLLDCESYVKAMARQNSRAFQAEYLGVFVEDGREVSANPTRFTDKARQCGARLESDPLIAADSAMVEYIKRDFYRRFEERLIAEVVRCRGIDAGASRPRSSEVCRQDLPTASTRRPGISLP